MIQYPALRLAALASTLMLAALPDGGALAQALQPIPPLASRVTDLTGTLTTTQQAQLESRLAEFESRKGAQGNAIITTTPGVAGAPDAASIVVKTPDGEIKVDVKQMEALAKQMEEMAAQMEKNKK